MQTLEIIFWLALALSMYVQVGYPLLLLLLVSVKFILNRTSLKACTDGDWEYQPTVSIIIAAYNEEKNIAAKIENTLQLDYPKEKLDIIVFSDASSDRTDEIVESYADQGVRLIRVEGRRGKTYCQNVAISEAVGEIIVFTDADSLIEPQAVRQMMRWFANPSVGCVSSYLRYVERSGESWYQQYETALLRLEGMLGSAVSAFGAFYAVRAHLCSPIPETLQEDLVRPLMVVYHRYRIVLAVNAVAWIHSAPTVEGEWRRRVRMVARGAYSLIRYPPMRALLNPFRYGFFALQVWSHRVLRWLHGIPLAVMLLSNSVLIMENTVYFSIGILQLGCYIAALIGYLEERYLGKRTFPPFHFAYYYLSAQIAMLQGFWKALRGDSFKTWKPIR
jgi:cellulose synthase/poly-beta-1,6-N-acetylglucosamine synthase-like glycosyltransferase